MERNGLTVFLSAVGLAAAAACIPLLKNGGMAGAGALPFAAALVLTVGGTAALIFGKSEKTKEKPLNLRLTVCMAACVLFCVLLAVGVPFIAAAAVLLYGLTVYCMKGGWLSSIPWTLGFTAAVYAVFGMLFKVL